MDKLKAITKESDELDKIISALHSSSFYLQYLNQELDISPQLAERFIEACNRRKAELIGEAKTLME